MTVKHRIAASLLALSAALPATLAATIVHAETRSTDTRAASIARIDSFSVAQQSKVGPGSEIEFTLTGTPGRNVMLRIAGATADLPLSEVRPGHYEGSYTVRSRDRITAASLVTARVEKDGEAVMASLDQSVISGAPSPVIASPKIAAFVVAGPDRVRPGDELKFSMNGSPAGRARVAVVGIQQPVALAEVSRGVYEGTYTLKRRDHPDKALSSTGFLSVNGKESTQRFERDQDRLRGSDRSDRSEHTSAAACVNCGVIEAVNLVETKAEGNNVVGTIAGGVVGGVLGHQVGGGSGKDLATIAGALGGAYAGNRVQNNMGKTTEYQVVVRLETGTTQTVKFAADPAFRTGERVRLENNSITRL
jgi:outer membrane lipoprotein SlyB